ncbi:hypothetical protein L9F63_000080, partial [Diploptera punctata]
VYQHVYGRKRGRHAVKIIGWGVEKSSNLPYWIIANSWNYTWGENGFFKIIRGSEVENEFEYGVHAGLPAL